MAVEQCNATFPFQKNVKFGSYMRVWDLPTSYSATTIARCSTITSGPWSISPDGNNVCCQGMKQYREEDLFLARCGTGMREVISCGFEGVINEYRKLYPQTCPFSPDGTMIASTFENTSGLHIMIHNPVSLDILHSVKITSACKGFKGTVASLVFSSDSYFLAVVSSRGQVFIFRSLGLKLRNSLDTEVIIQPLEMLDQTISEPCTCEFDPRFPHEVFATCTFYRGLVKIWEIVPSRASPRRGKIENVCEIQLTRVINSIKYSTEGDILAVGCSEGIITCLDPDDGSTVFELDTSIQSPEFQSTAGIYHLAFSRSGEHLAASYSDGYIRVWQLPVLPNLQHFCRIVINESFPASKIHMLPLPAKIKNYLLYKRY